MEAPTRAGEVTGAKGSEVPKATETVEPNSKTDDYVPLKDQMSEAAAQRYEQWNKYVGAGIEPADRVKLGDWVYPPEPEFYLANKSVYDNPDYFNQITGNPVYPGTPESALGRVDGSVHKDGFLNGEYKKSVLIPGTKINRIGSNPTGRYFSP